MVEFSLVGIILLVTLFGFLNFSHALFVRSLLRYAVSQGIRYAITGQTRSGLSHAESIKAVVQDNALGLLKTSAGAASIQVRYYLPDGVTQTTVVAGNNLIEVAIEDYPLMQLVPLWGNWTITNRLIDVLEPFDGVGGGGGGGGGGECISSS